MAQNNNTEENISIIWSYFTIDLFINFVFALFVILITFWVSKVVTNRLSLYIENLWKIDWANRDELISVITRTTNIFVIIIGFSITLSLLWVNMWIFMWWIWFWIWFTLKTFLSNFIGWILMVTQWTYHRWDLIKISWKIWYIREIHTLYTAMEQFDWIIYFVPNIKFLEDDVLNYNTNSKRRIEIKIQVDYDTDIIKVKELLIKLSSKIDNILDTPKPSVYLDQLDSSSINIILRVWIDSKSEYFQIKAIVIETINHIFKKEWIKIPFPQITISNREQK